MFFAYGCSSPEIDNVLRDVETGSTETGTSMIVHAELNWNEVIFKEKYPYLYVIEDEIKDILKKTNNTKGSFNLWIQVPKSSLDNWAISKRATAFPQNITILWQEFAETKTKTNQ